MHSIPWIPDSDGNLTAEKGDNAATLSKFLGVKQEDANKILSSQDKTDVKEGDKVTLDNVYTRSIKNSTGDLTTDKVLELSAKGQDVKGPDVDNYNCWGSAIAGTQGKEINNTVGIPTGSKFDVDLVGDYKPVDKESATFGNTVLRFSNENNVAEHGAVFYGKSNDGTIFVYTKDGWNAKPEVMKLSDLQTKIPSYGTVKGVNSSDSGYYNPNP